MTSHPSRVTVDTHLYVRRSLNKGVWSRKLKPTNECFFVLWLHFGCNDLCWHEYFEFRFPTALTTHLSCKLRLSGETGTFFALMSLNKVQITVYQCFLYSEAFFLGLNTYFLNIALVITLINMSCSQELSYVRLTLQKDHMFHIKSIWIINNGHECTGRVCKFLLCHWTQTLPAFDTTPALIYAMHVLALSSSDGYRMLRIIRRSLYVLLSPSPWMLSSSEVRKFASHYSISILAVLYISDVSNHSELPVGRTFLSVTALMLVTIGSFK